MLVGHKTVKDALGVVSQTCTPNPVRNATEGYYQHVPRTK